MTNAIPSSIQGQPTSLKNEPDLIDSIASQAQDATTEEGAEKFEAAAQKLEKAYEQVSSDSARSAELALMRYHRIRNGLANTRNMVTLEYKSSR